MPDPEEKLDLEIEENEDKTPEGEEFSEVEQEAMTKGWSPEGVEGKPNLSAEEFVARQPLYDKMHKTDRMVKRLEERDKAITAHLEQMRKSMSDDRVEGLKDRKRNILAEQEEGWTDDVIKIDEQIVEASQEQPIVVENAPANEAFDVWLDDNQWYENNDDMRAYADKLGTGIITQNPNMNVKDIYAEVAEDVKLRFADQFTTRTQTSPVEGGRPQSRKAKAATYTAKDLDPEAAGIMSNLVRSGVMTESEYIADLEKTGYFN